MVSISACRTLITYTLGERGIYPRQPRSIHLWYVLLPLILPGILSKSIIVFAFVFASYEIPLLLGVRFPTTLPVLAFQSYQNLDLALRPQAMAMSVILAVIAVVLLVAHRRLVKYAIT